MSARFTVADLAASGVLEHGRNRQRLAEAAGLPFHELPRTRPVSPPVGEPPGEGAPPGPSSQGEEGRPPHTAEAPAQARPRRGGADAPGDSEFGSGPGAKTPGDTAPPVADINALALAVLGEPRRLPRLEGEDAIQADIVFRFDVGTRAGKWSIIPVILRNDIRVRTASDAELAAAPALALWHQRQQRQAWKEGARAKAMGMRPGAPDLLLLSPAGFGFLECKSPGASLRPEQRAWRDLCGAAGWNWGLARSWDDALRAVKAWDWIKS